MTENYWKKRCELAERYIKENPCDPDIYKEQLTAYNNWIEFKKLPIPVFSGSLVDDKFMKWLAKEAPELCESLYSCIHDYETYKDRI